MTDLHIIFNYFTKAYGYKIYSYVLNIAFIWQYIWILKQIYKILVFPANFVSPKSQWMNRHKILKLLQNNNFVYILFEWLKYKFKNQVFKRHPRKIFAILVIYFGAWVAVYSEIHIKQIHWLANFNVFKTNHRYWRHNEGYQLMLVTLFRPIWLD